jgi:hypothetical protein
MNFGQDASHAEDRKAALIGSLPGDFEQGRFPDSGLAADNERRSTLIDAVDQPIDKSNVLLAAL